MDPSSEEVLTRLMARHPEGVDYPMAQAYAGGLAQLSRDCWDPESTRPPTGRYPGYHHFYWRYALTSHGPPVRASHACHTVAGWP